jgi:hypothetical protein
MLRLTFKRNCVKRQYFRISLAVCLICAGAARAGEDLTVAPNEPAAGLSQAEWSRNWWQWAGSFDQDQSPIADRTGALCNAKQDGPVWFLAGTYGTRRTVRTCKVPSGKYLFFPRVKQPARAAML